MKLVNLQKIVISLLVILSIALMSSNFNAQESKIIGKWQTEKKDSKIEFFKSRNTYCVKLLWGKAIVEKDGETYKKRY